MKIFGFIILSFISVFVYGQSLDTNSFVITPNPFVVSTTIEFELIDNDTTTLLVYDIFGHVDTLYFQDTVLNQGLYSFEYQTDINGIYLVRLIVGEDEYIKKVVKLDSLNFVKEFSQLNKVILYPNPINDQLNLAYEIKESTFVVFKVIDIYGKVVFVKRENKTAGNYQEQINLNKLSRGIYFFVAEIDGITQTNKIVKVR
jgi:hypothetical protein